MKTRIHFKNPRVIGGKIYDKGMHAVPTADLLKDKWFVKAQFEEGHISFVDPLPDFAQGENALSLKDIHSATPTDPDSNNLGLKSASSDQSGSAAPKNINEAMKAQKEMIASAEDDNMPLADSSSEDDSESEEQEESEEKANSPQRHKNKKGR